MEEIATEGSHRPVPPADPIEPHHVEPAQPDQRYGTFVDWRTIDPATIQGDNIPVEELRYFRENIDEMLRSREGQYVLIVGRRIVSYHKDLGAAARVAEKDFRGQKLLIKKVARFEPVHSLGGVVR